MTEDEFKAVIVKALAWMENAQDQINHEWYGKGPDDEVLAMRQVVSMMTGEPMKVDEPPPPPPPPEPDRPNRDEEIAKIITETDPAEVQGMMALIVEVANLRARTTTVFDQGRLDYLEKLMLLARKKDAMG